MAAMGELYPIGATVTVLSPVLMRTEEDLSSLDLQEIPPGEPLEVMAHGLAPASRRLHVRHRASFLEGWISCATRSGEELIEPVPAKVWIFLLPNSGKHQLRVEHIATADQRLIIDGQVVEREGCIFEGPSNSLLEFRPQGDQWLLFVDGLRVEDCNPGKRTTTDDGLRELRSMPDGSYLISTDFDAGSLELNVIRKFRFFAVGRVHEVRVAHKECIWQVICDGKLVERKAHRLTESRGDVNFAVELEDGRALEASVHMAWQSIAMVWRYTLIVNGFEVAECWIKSKGDVRQGDPLPVVVGAETPLLASGYVPGLPPPASSLDQVEAASVYAPPQGSLPQGVSFDTASGVYQANIRGRTGKFIFLGEFATPNEAHQKYLEAVPVHCPERALAPNLPAYG